jgi:MFS family permease
MADDVTAGVADDGRRGLTIGLVTIVTLVAFEALAVITILPDIAEDLGTVAGYGWVSTAFFLGTMVGIVLAGEQADRRGAGRPYVAGLMLFAAGLTIGGLATSIQVLVIGRFVQGLGAGVVPAIGYVAIGRVFSVERRARMFAVLSTAWVVPGLVGPALAERISSWVGWRWVFLGLLPFVAVAGSVIVPAMMRLGPLRADDAGAVPFLRRRVVEAARVAGGAALVVGSFTASRWLIVPAVIAGGLIAIGPLRRLTPPGTLRGAVGLPAVVLSRGVLTFAFFGTDTFVPHALTAGRDRSTLAGSIAVTVGTLSWTTGAWLQERWIVRTGEAFFVRRGFLVLAPGIAVVAVAALPDVLPFWAIHLAWAACGVGMGLAYSAHAQAVLRCAPAERYGQSTASLQLLDNLGVALGTGTVGVIVTTGDTLGWEPGRAVAIALTAPLVVAVFGAALSRRFPRPTAPATPSTPAPPETAATARHRE